MIDLAAVLAPLNPVQHDQWRVRGGQPFTPAGIVLHHTASSTKSGPTGSLRTVLNGRPGIPGPLCHILVGRDASVHLIAAGRANHAGSDSSVALAEMAAGKVGPATKTAAARKLRDDVVGNRQAWGVEIENNGTTEPWSDAVVDVVGHLCALICEASGWTEGHVTTHRNLTARKTDPWGTTDWWAATRRWLLRG